MKTPLVAGYFGMLIGGIGINMILRVSPTRMELALWLCSAIAGWVTNLCMEDKRGNSHGL